MSPPGVPTSLEELLDPNWLTAALQMRFPGVEVTGVTPGPVVSRLSTNARFRIECKGALPVGLAPALCAKGYFAPNQRGLGFLGEPEARFYATLAETTGVRTLRCVYADVHPDTRHGVVITHDVVAAGGAFLDALTPYSADQTAASLEELAKLHAATWGNAGPRVAWVRPRFIGVAPSDASSGAPAFTAMRGVDDVRHNFDGPIGAGVPHGIRRNPQRVVDAMRVLATREIDEGGAVVHGDAHVGNLVLEADGRPALVDWQVIHRDHWSIDVAYHIASALESSDRRSRERELLAHYLEHLRASDIGAPAWDEAWDDYRTGIAYGVFMWGVTRLVDPEIVQRLLQRLTTAAAEHHTFERLGV